MKDAVDDDPKEFVVKGGLHHLRIRTYRVKGNEDVSVQSGRSGVVERDDIRVIVMPEELAVDLQFALVGAEDIVDIPHSEAIVGGYRLDPPTDLALIQPVVNRIICSYILSLKNQHPISKISYLPRTYDALITH